MNLQQQYEIDRDSEFYLEPEQELDFNHEPAPEGEAYRFTDTLVTNHDDD